MFCWGVIFILIFRKEGYNMARKKRLKMPNGFGSIKYLGKNRRNPYGVYPAAERDEDGNLYTPKAIGYTATWEDAYELLTAYNMDKKGKIKTTTGTFIDRTPTLSEVYKEFYQEKYINNKNRKYSTSTLNTVQSAFKNLAILHDRQVGDLKYKDLQEVLNTCKLKHSSQAQLVSLIHQLYAYMMKYEIVDTDYSVHLAPSTPPDYENGEAFTEEELKILWNNKEDSIVQMILIMCYSGFRIKAYTQMDTNVAERYFKGGVKTKTSIDRLVPIHSAIIDFVSSRDPHNLLGMSDYNFRNAMYGKLEELNLSHTANGKKHTPHDCRHTFSALCEQYKVRENDRKRMLGHSFGSDITNATYGHRTVEQLRTEIEKIKLPATCC
jgi:integrase